MVVGWSAAMRIGGCLVAERVKRRKLAETLDVWLNLPGHLPNAGVMYRIRPNGVKTG